MCKDRCMQVNPTCLTDCPWLLLIVIANWELMACKRMKVRSLLCEYRVMRGMNTGFCHVHLPKCDPQGHVEARVISSLVPWQRPWEVSKLRSNITGHPTLSAI